MADSVTVSVTVDGQPSVAPTPGVPGTGSPVPTLNPRPGLPVTGFVTVLLFLAVGLVVLGVACLRLAPSSHRRSH